MIDVSIDGDVATLRLAHGKASALDVALLEGLVGALDEIEASTASACILTGTGSIFSAGVDLKQLMEGGDAYLDAFLPALGRAFERLFFFPRPLIGAANGHAIAGGCVLLGCCDLRIAAEGKGRFGVPELAVGVPFPVMALEIMRFTVPPNRIQEVLYSGQTYGVAAALERGLVDEVVAADALESRARDAAAALGRYPRNAFSFSKELARRPVAETLAAHRAEDDRRVRELWGSEDVRGAIAAYVEATLRRG